MPKLSIKVPHALPREEAVSRVNKLVERVKERNADKFTDLKEEWAGDKLNFSFKTWGFNIKGTGQVSDDAVQIDGDLPFAAMMFKGKIEQEVKSTLERHLA